ncbi:PilZ domain-containing protein [Desulfohalovibrio reitneri]|uniref:PilZ domain-containing protein n=1 Tax=Desulfohalovibrio reitneri TaxID=1307759 RepID=UPI0004A6DBE2|nr:PilZ domain-containing protein [Desulfohalovibrio reitneri]
MDDRRAVQRFDLKLPSRVMAVADEATYHLVTENVSSHGALFHTKQPLESGTRVEVTMFLSIPGELGGSRQSVIRSQGEVIRRGEGAMAVCFDQPGVLLATASGVPQ